jgi:hypothetical protein
MAAGSSGEFQEFTVRVPARDEKKKYHVMKFSGSQNIDFSKWTQARMVRENNEKILNFGPKGFKTVKIVNKSSSLQMTTPSSALGLCSGRTRRRRPAGRRRASPGGCMTRRSSLG